MSRILLLLLCDPGDGTGPYSAPTAAHRTRVALGPSLVSMTTGWAEEVLITRDMRGHEA